MSLHLVEDADDTIAQIVHQFLDEPGRGSDRRAGHDENSLEAERIELVRKRLPTAWASKDPIWDGRAVEQLPIDFRRHVLQSSS